MHKWLLVWFVLSLLLPIFPSTSASAENIEPYTPDGQATIKVAAAMDWQVTEAAEDMLVQWGMDTRQISAAQTERSMVLFSELPQVWFGGYLLPMHLTPLLLTTEERIAPLLADVATMPWSAPLPVAAPLTPTVIGGEDLIAARRELAEPALTLPSSPLFVLREGRMRGMRIAVVAFSPIYVEAGAVRVAYAGRAHIPHSKALPPTTALFSREAGSTQTKNAISLLPTPSGPTNDAALKRSGKVVVSEAGIQQVTGDALLTAGFAANLALHQLQLWWQGVQIPLEIRDADDRLDAHTQIRFYAAPSAHTMSVGDRWRRTTTYWLTVEEEPGLRINQREVLPSQAPLRHSAFVRTIWEDNRLYESTMAGVDDDHWFAAALETEAIQPDNPASNPVKTITLTHALPLDVNSTESSELTLTGSARLAAQHLLYVKLGKTVHSITWQHEESYTNWQHTLTTQEHSNRIDLVLVAGHRPSLLRLDKVYGRQPVQLDFQGRGAFFEGAAGRWRYVLSNVPPQSSLYDITDPLQPTLLATSTAPTIEFEDGPDVRQYLLAAADHLHIPTLTLHTPLTFSATEGADAVYIAPARFHGALAPLVAHRRQQGYTVRLVDVQDLYDGWSYGQVAPEAIRQFLRFAVTTWTPSPVAAVLVGDGTIDPRNYMGYQDGGANLDLMPAYLAPIDPWIGETACESCFGQLDGDSPLDAAEDPAFLLDIWIGRLSVQDEAQARTVVEKLLAYETAQPADLLAPWHQSSFYVADNYIHPNGQKDSAGDFAAYADFIVDGDHTQSIDPIQSPQIFTRRLYYDPTADGITQPWREANAGQARLRVIEELRQGPALVTYHGHSNHFQWGTTDPSFDPPYLFSANDIFLLDNQTQPFVLLQMTCLTSQFAFVSPSGTTIDERFWRHENGGAVAVWGSAGLTVAAGQDKLLRGFQAQLWTLPPLTARLGELTAAGYFHLFANGVCCQETRYSYLLLGDPLTPLLLWTPLQNYLPIVHN